MTVGGPGAGEIVDFASGFCFGAVLGMWKGEYWGRIHAGKEVLYFKDYDRRVRLFVGASVTFKRTSDPDVVCGVEVGFQWYFQVAEFRRLGFFVDDFFIAAWVPDIIHMRGQPSRVVEGGKGSMEVGGQAFPIGWRQEFATIFDERPESSLGIEVVDFILRGACAVQDAIPTSRVPEQSLLACGGSRASTKDFGCTVKSFAVDCLGVVGGQVPFLVISSSNPARSPRVLLHFHGGGQNRWHSKFLACSSAKDFLLEQDHALFTLCDGIAGRVVVPILPPPLSSDGEDSLEQFWFRTGSDSQYCSWNFESMSWSLHMEEAIVGLMGMVEGEFFDGRSPTWLSSGCSLGALALSDLWMRRREMRVASRNAFEKIQAAVLVSPSIAAPQAQAALKTILKDPNVFIFTSAQEFFGLHQALVSEPGPDVFARSRGLMLAYALGVVSPAGVSCRLDFSACSVCCSGSGHGGNFTALGAVSAVGCNQIVHGGPFSSRRAICAVVQFFGGPVEVRPRRRPPPPPPSSARMIGA